VSEVGIGKRHELTLLEFVTFDDIRPIDLFAGLLVDPMKADWGEVAAVEHVQRQRVLLGGSVQFHRDVHQTKGDGAFP